MNLNQQHTQPNHPHHPTIKKLLPPYWSVLKHPSIDSTRLNLPNEPFESLTDQQRSTYDHLFNTLNSPNFRLPTPTNSSSSNPQTIDVRPSKDSWDPSLSESEKSFCSQECLLRICRATRWDPNRALKRCIDTLVWRREFQVDQLDYRELSHEAETGKLLTLGYDKHQRPLLYMFPYRENTKPSINQIQLLVWYLERTIDLMPPGVETLTLIIDFGDRTKTSKSSGLPIAISTAKEVLKILQTYYCERLAQAICVNVPWVFGGFLKILKPFMDPKTAEKILFDPVITDYVPKEQLLKDGFGGDLDFQYDHETYFPLLAELTAHRRQKMLSRYRRRGEGMIGMTEFELRGGHRRIKGQSRESSLGSSSTDTSSPIPGSKKSTHPSSQPNSRQYIHPSSSTNASESTDRTAPLVSFRSLSNARRSLRLNDQDPVWDHASSFDDGLDDTQGMQTFINLKNLEGTSALKEFRSLGHSEPHPIRAPVMVASYASRPLSFDNSTSSIELKKAFGRSKSLCSDQDRGLKIFRSKLTCRQKISDGSSESEEPKRMLEGRDGKMSPTDLSVHRPSTRLSVKSTGTPTFGHYPLRPPPQPIKARFSSPQATLSRSLGHQGLVQKDEAGFSRRVNLISS